MRIQFPMPRQVPSVPPSFRPFPPPPLSPRFPPPPSDCKQGLIASRRLRETVIMTGTPSSSSHSLPWLGCSRRSVPVLSPVLLLLFKRRGGRRRKVCVLAGVKKSHWYFEHVYGHEAAEKRKIESCLPFQSPMKSNRSTKPMAVVAGWLIKLPICVRLSAQLRGTWLAARVAVWESV